MSDWYCEELLSGRTEVERIFGNEAVIAYWHTRPHYPHHAVVTTKTHVDSLLEIDAGALANVLEVVKAVAALFGADYGGAHVVTNLGRYRDSGHFHVHRGSD